MKILESIADLRAYQKNLKTDLKVGFVPTMGALHPGHASLIKTSKQQNAYTIVSIFVNPTQFGANEDLNRYPRPFENDCKICQDLGVDAVFAPKAQEIYQNSDETTLYPPKQMAHVLEGASRPGHFNGVLQIVLKLFSLIQPHNAYFGQKDAQQLLIIKRMVEDLFLPIKIIPCPTIRDKDTLALSSRNIYLSLEERQIALEIPRSLQCIQKLISQGETQTQTLIDEAKKNLQNVQLDYLEITDYHLKKISTIQPQNSLALIAAKVGNTRLIDNLWI